MPKRLSNIRVAARTVATNPRRRPIFKHFVGAGSRVYASTLGLSIRLVLFVALDFPINHLATELVDPDIGADQAAHADLLAG